jgi:hypothetical protein
MKSREIMMDGAIKEIRLRRQIRIDQERAENSASAKYAI